MAEREWVISNSMSGFVFFPRGLRRRHLEVVKRKNRLSLHGQSRKSRFSCGGAKKKNKGRVSAESSQSIHYAQTALILLNLQYPAIKQ